MAVPGFAGRDVAVSGHVRDRRAWRRSSARIAALPVLVLLSASCGVGGALAASAGGGGGGGQSPAPVPTSTVVLEGVDGADAVGTEQNPAANLVTLRFRFSDVGARAVTVVPQWKPVEEDDWRTMTLVRAAGTDPTSGLDLSGEGRKSDVHSVLWNSLVDLPRPSLLTTRFKLHVRVQFRYDGSPAPGRLQAKPSLFYVDYHLGATIASEETKLAPGFASVPAGLKFLPDGLLVACAQSDIVDRLNSSGTVDRLIGRGVFLPPGTEEPGDPAVGDAIPSKANDAVAKLVKAATGDPAAVEPRGLLGLAADEFGNVVTANHYYLTLTALGAPPGGGVAPCPTIRVPSDTTMIVSLPAVPGGPPVKLGPACCRRPAFHPSGALLYSDTTTIDFATPDARIRNRIVALNPQDPAAPGGTTVTIAGTDLAPGESTTIYDSSDATMSEPTPQMARIHGLAVGPSGEVYFDARVQEGADGGGDIGDFVMAFNPTSSEIRVGAVRVPARRAVTVAGPYRVALTRDARDVAKWDIVSESPDDPTRFLSIAVSKDQHVLFVAAPARNDQNVYAVDLEPGRAVRPTFAGVEIPEADPEAADAARRLGAHLVCDAAAGGACGITLEFDDATPVNAIEVDGAGGRLFVAHDRYVTLINGGAAPLAAYGKGPIAPGGHDKVYDGTDQFGIPISRPRGVAARGQDLVFFADDRVIRALNLAPGEVSVLGTTVAPGTFEVVAGAAASGFCGDGGRARSARFRAPAAMVASRQNALFVADTGNDRIRLIHIGDPATADNLQVFGATVLPGDVTTVGGGGSSGQPDDGDDGPPAAASLSMPQGLALRLSDGVVFVADTGHDRIRAMNPSTFDVSIAGTVVAANTIKTIVGHGIDGVAAPGTTSGPTALAIDGDLLFFAEVGTHRIRAVNLSDTPQTLYGGALTIPAGEIRTICGTGAPGNDGDGGPAVDARIDAPAGLAVARDQDGRRLALYFTDGAQSVLRMVNLSDGNLTPPSGDPGASAAVAPGHVVTVSSVPAAVAAAPSPGDVTQPGYDSRTPTRILLHLPAGVVVTEKLGNEQLNARPAAASVFVADGGSNRLVRFPAEHATR